MLAFKRGIAVKKVKAIILALLCIFLLASCTREDNLSLSSAQIKATESEKIQSDDFASNDSKTVIWGECRFDLPDNWSYEFTEDSVGVYIYPDTEQPPVFCFTPLNTDVRYDLSDKDIQASLAASITDDFKNQLGKCELIDYNAPEAYFELSDGSKINVTGRYSVHITCSSEINGRPCKGYIIAFYLKDTLYSFNLFEYNDSTYSFIEDLKCIVNTIKLKEIIKPSDETDAEVTKEAVTEDNTDNTNETTEKTEKYVYITNTGSKYHTVTCRWVSESCIKILYEDAKAEGYTPCGTCNPD